CQPLEGISLPSDPRLESDDPAQVDARDAADPHENQEHLATSAATRDTARPARVDDRLGEEPRGATGRAHACRGGEIDAQDLDQVAGDRVAVESDHVGPNLSVLMRAGECPSITSASATASTKPVGPQT